MKSRSFGLLFYFQNNFAILNYRKLENKMKETENQVIVEEVTNELNYIRRQISDLKLMAIRNNMWKNHIALQYSIDKYY